MEKYKDIESIAYPPKPHRSFFYYVTMVSKVLLSLGLIAAAANSVLGHPMQSYGDHDLRPQQQQVISALSENSNSGDPGAPEGDGGKTADAVFAGIPTFAHLPYEQCWSNSSVQFDIAFIGAPFDTGTSYRPGARFGPAGIRDGSRRLALYGGYNVPMDVNPFQAGAKIVDCSDIFVT